MLKKIIGIGIVILLLAGIFIVPKLMLFMNSRLTSVNEHQVEFYIRKETKLKPLAEELARLGIIKDQKAFIELGEYKALSEENIALGKYIIKPGTQYRSLLNGFKKNAAGNGNAEVEVDVTFNNCRFMSDIAVKVANCLMMDSTQLIEYLNDRKTYSSFGFNKEQFPAMFIPDTYKMFYDTDPEEFVKRMSDEYRKFWSKERKDKIAAIGLRSAPEVVTLASIVYSEQSRVEEEWPIIAGLYLNRLEQGIKLQSDPTFKFCWGKKLDGLQRLLFIHRDIDCPYNTYKIDGLPPGPICITPASAIEAVLNRKKHDYIFMMARPDFSHRHNFSKDYATHLQLAKVYQKWLSTLK
ncbi:MAG: endolytic transglycosylase MltG [Bacteroidota bacterium]|jgi:UPF0755 protein